MRIDCKTVDCGFYVEYEAWEVQYLLLKAISTLRERHLEEVSVPDFNLAVKTVVLDKANDFNTTKAVYLTCENCAAPHTNAYLVPAK